MSYNNLVNDSFSYSSEEDKYFFVDSLFNNRRFNNKNNFKDSNNNRNNNDNYNPNDSKYKFRYKIISDLTKQPIFFEKISEGIHKIGLNFFNQLYTNNTNNIKQKIESLFSLKNININNLSNTNKSEINFKYVFFNNFYNLIVAPCNDSSYILSSIQPTISVNEIYTETYEFICDYFDNLHDIQRHEMVNEQQKQKNDIESDIEIASKIKRGLTKLLIEILKQSNKITCYGSFSAHCIDNSISFNDIDIYHQESFYFMICILMLLSIITDEHINVFHIPMIIGHLSLRVRETTILECFQMPSYMFNKLKIRKINNVRCVYPGLQFFNNIKMKSETQTINKLFSDEVKTKKKEAAILAYFLTDEITNNNIKTKSMIDLLKNIRSIDNKTLIENMNLINYDIIVDRDTNITYIEYDLECVNRYFNIKEPEFERLYIIVGRKLNMIQYIQHYDIDGRYSRKFYTVLPEIFFEDTSKNLIFSISGSSVHAINLEQLHTLSIQNIIATFVSYLYIHNKKDKFKYFQYILMLMRLEQGYDKSFTKYTFGRERIDKVIRDGVIVDIKPHIEISYNKYRFTARPKNDDGFPGDFYTNKESFDIMDLNNA